LKEYVAGFLFSTDRSRVVLICKEKPAWQAGKLNGVGGKIERDELPHQAMRREFFEETGAKTCVSDWHHFCRYQGEDCVVHFFRAFKDLEVESVTSELVRWYYVRELNTYPTLPNLSWLVPFALDETLSHSEVYEVA